jgi:hypothetical protein
MKQNTTLLNLDVLLDYDYEERMTVEVRRRWIRK